MTDGSLKSRKVNPADFPHLSDFARGYLHQDLIPEYGDPLRATRAYLNDVGAADRKRVAQEAFQFRNLVQGWSQRQVNTALAALGGSWNFISSDELNEVLQILERGH